MHSTELMNNIMLFCRSQTGSLTDWPTLPTQLAKLSDKGICLFVCLGFNGTFSTNRLYCAI